MFLGVWFMFGERCLWWAHLREKQHCCVQHCASGEYSYVCELFTLNPFLTAGCYNREETKVWEDWESGDYKDLLHVSQCNLGLQAATRWQWLWSVSKIVAGMLISSWFRASLSVVSHEVATPAVECVEKELGMLQLMIHFMTFYKLLEFVKWRKNWLNHKLKWCSEPLCLPKNCKFKSNTTDCLSTDLNKEVNLF